VYILQIKKRKTELKLIVFCLKIETKLFIKMSVRKTEQLLMSSKNLKISL